MDQYETIRREGETYYRGDAVGLMCRVVFALGVLFGGVLLHAARKFVFND